MGPRTGMEKRKILPLPRIETRPPSPQFVAITTELSRLQRPKCILILLWIYAYVSQFVSPCTHCCLYSSDGNWGFDGDVAPCRTLPASAGLSHGSHFHCCHWSCCGFRLTLNWAFSLGKWRQTCANNPADPYIASELYFQRSESEPGLMARMGPSKTCLII
jgi:hypothetical protein